MSKWKRKPNVQQRSRKSWQLQEARDDAEVQKGLDRDEKREEMAIKQLPKMGIPLQTPKDSILDFFLESPFPELDLDMQRDKDTGRDIEL